MCPEAKHDQRELESPWWSPNGAGVRGKVFSLRLVVVRKLARRGPDLGQEPVPSRRLAGAWPGDRFDEPLVSDGGLEPLIESISRQIGRAHVCTPVTRTSRMSPSA